jgi:hypothetical protein
MTLLGVRPRAPVLRPSARDTLRADLAAQIANSASLYGVDAALSVYGTEVYKLDVRKQQERAANRTLTYAAAIAGIALTSALIVSFGHLVLGAVLAALGAATALAWWVRHRTASARVRDTSLGTGLDREMRYGIADLGGPDSLPALLLALPGQDDELGRILELHMALVRARLTPEQVDVLEVLAADGFTGTIGELTGVACSLS